MNGTYKNNEENVLIERLTRTVLENIQNEQFGVEELSREVGISRSHLHRRLKLIKKESVSQFIRRIRLEEAMKLLQANAGSAAEIGYLVGFNSNSYFHKCFNDYFGYPPGEVKKGPFSDTNSTTVHFNRNIAITSNSEGLNNKNIIQSQNVNTTPQRKTLIQKNFRLFIFPILLIFMLLLYWAYIVFQKQTKSENVPLVSIAVLPLDHLSGDQEQEYLTSGVHDVLIGALSKVSKLRVISKTSAMHFKDTQLSIQEIAKELGVDFVIEGSVRVNEDSLRILLQLIKPFPQEKNLWTEEYYGNISQVYSIQNNLIKNVTQDIQISLTPEEEKYFSTPRPINPETYKAYLRGMYYINKTTLNDYQKGLEYLNEAIESDPADPLAYAGLAMGYTMVGHGPGHNENIWKKGRAAALRAIRLDSTLAEAQSALAFIKLYYERDWIGAEIAFKKANELNPNLAINHFHYAWFLAAFERYDEALKEHLIAKSLDPFTPIYTIDLGSLYNYMGRNDDALVELKQGLEIFPNSSHGWWMLGCTYAYKGMYDKAIETVKKAERLNQSWAWSVGNIYALAGNKEKALQVITKLKNDINPRNAYGIGMIYTSLGNMDEAYKWYNYQPSDVWLPWIYAWPENKRLHNDPEFLAFLKKHNLPPFASSLEKQHALP